MMIYNTTKYNLDFLSEYYKDITDLEQIDEDITAVIVNYSEDIYKSVKQIHKLYKKAKIIVITDLYDKEIHHNSLKYKIIYAQVNNLDDLKMILKNLKLFEDYQGLQIDYNTKKVKIGDLKVKLTTKEIEIFKYLYEHKNQNVSRQDILVDVLNYHPDADKRIIDVYIKYLRNKLGDEGKKIKTIRGVGYNYEY